MDTILAWVEKVVDMLFRMPVLVGVVGGWSMTQMHKWVMPPKKLADYTDAQRAYRTRQVAFLSGMVFTILAYMNPEVRTEASMTMCYVTLGTGWCIPPLKAFVVAPLVGIACIPLWDVLMHWVEMKWPEFYKKYISGKPVTTTAVIDFDVLMPDGTTRKVERTVEILTDSKGRFLKLRLLDDNHDGLTIVLGQDDQTVPGAVVTRND